MRRTVFSIIFKSKKTLWPNHNTQILILGEAPLRFVLKVFSVLRRWRARYSVPSGCLGRTVVQNLTPDVAWLSKQDICIPKQTFIIPAWFVHSLDNIQPMTKDAVTKHTALMLKMVDTVSIWLSICLPFRIIIYNSAG